MKLVARVFASEAESMTNSVQQGTLRPVWDVTQKIADLTKDVNAMRMKSA